MHELGITRNIVEIVCHEARGRKVSRVKLMIGELTAVAPRALSFCFDEVTKNTVMDGASLEIVSIKGRAKCLDCNEEFYLPLTGAQCECGSRKYELIAGEELKIVEMELH